ncbi:hypothetical protein H6P81_000567 [Aristolochia fimbriata]|uniref:WAT1-related protein n=1 Tax=Aristolochia fimbriata TaxID=158543 RepID=A0AAV7F595_ARIFI|nr:hypothetical protein H6P81_000567 [Aristolochia fimbriata]
MGKLERYKPELVMIGLQFIYATVTISTRAALTEGMSPKVFVVYRQALSTLVMSPIAYFCRRKEGAVGMGWRSFFLIFASSLIGVAFNQNLYMEGIYLASSTIGSAMSNIIPALTFCLGSFITIGESGIWEHKDPGEAVGENWLLGCLFLFGSSCCWSLWLILQVPMSASYPDHLSLSAWMCFFATLQSAALAWFLEPDSKAWVFNSRYELFSCFFAGVIGSGVTFFGQSWCISKRGPLFSAMFSPLNTVIVAIFACLLLHERLYLGSVIGAFAVVGGLYAVLWGKAKDYEKEEAVVLIGEEGIVEKMKMGTAHEIWIHTCITAVDMKEPLLAPTQDHHTSTP